MSGSPASGPRAGGDTVRAVFFDFDRTLGRARSHLGIYVQAARDHGIRVSEEELAAAPLDDAWARWRTGEGPDHRDWSGDEATYARLRGEIARSRLVAAGALADLETLELIGARVAELEGDPAQYELYPDTPRALERLSRRGVVSLVVSNHVWRLPEIIRSMGISSRFEAVLTSARVGVRKPHRRIYEAALGLVGCDAREVLMVGDSYRDDVLGARALGMAAVLIDRAGQVERPPIEVPVISSLAELELP